MASAYGTALITGASVTCEKDERFLLPDESWGTKKQYVHLQGTSMVGFPGDYQHRRHVRDPEPLSEPITETDMTIMQCIHI